MIPTQQASLHTSNLAGRLLAALDAASPSTTVRVMTQFLEDALESSSVRLLLIDYDLAMLTELLDDPEASGACLPVEGSDAGKAFRTQETMRVITPQSLHLYVPVTVRAEQLGVLHLELPHHRDDPGLVRDLNHVGVCLAYVLKAGLPFSEVLERARRHQHMELAAEMQWALQPIRAYECPEFSIAGQLVPAYEVGGDMFDYAIEADALQVAVTDAMGHGLRASLLTTLAVNTIRNARRSGHSIAEQAIQANKVLSHQFGGDQYVTALAMRADLTTGEVSVINAGSPPPCLINSQAMRRVRFRADLPLGLFPEIGYTEQRFMLHPGDRLVLVSDGVMEANPHDGGEAYGERRLEGALLATRNARPHETARLIANGLRSYRGTHLRDDATIVCLDWRGRP